MERQRQPPCRFPCTYSHLPRLFLREGVTLAFAPVPYAMSAHTTCIVSARAFRTGVAQRHSRACRRSCAFALIFCATQRLNQESGFSVCFFLSRVRIVMIEDGFVFFAFFFHFRESSSPIACALQRLIRFGRFILTGIPVVFSISCTIIPFDKKIQKPPSKPGNENTNQQQQTPLPQRQSNNKDNDEAQNPSVT
jgi:hypothetical protein